MKTKRHKRTTLTGKAATRNAKSMLIDWYDSLYAIEQALNDELETVYDKVDARGGTATDKQETRILELEDAIDNLEGVNDAYRELTDRMEQFSEELKGGGK